MGPQVGQILEILKKGKMGHFQGNCSSRKKHAGMKQINFSGTLVRVDCKSPPNFGNQHKIFGTFLVIFGHFGLFDHYWRS